MNGNTVSANGVQPKKRLLKLQALVIVFLLSVFVFLGHQALTFMIGPLHNDEWHCSEGEAPVITDLAGTQCLEEGSVLPVGFSWDPLGNRPYNCDHRWKWQPIEHVETGEKDCMKETKPLAIPPTGWQYVNYRIMT